jgi:probable HAF family extracellular repeat protein
VRTLVGVFGRISNEAARQFHWRAVYFCAVIVLPPIVSAQAPPEYLVTDLGRLGGSMSFGFGVNNLGQVAGQSDLPGDGQDRAFLYSNGIMQDLGTLPGDFLSLGRAVNDLGQVTGTSDGISASYAMLYSNGVMQSLGSFGGNTSAAFGINNSGQITGYAFYSNGISHAFLYSNGTMRDIGALGGSSSWGNSINASGQITGTATLATANEHAFLYSNGSMVDLGTLGGTFSVGRSINNAGQVVGTSSVSGNNANPHAFLYTGGVMQDLGTLGGTFSNAIAINNAGQILGVSTFPGDATSAPFLYQGGTMYNLMSLLKPGSGVTSLSLSDNGLNDLGQIAATAVINGHEDAVLLTPTAVPARSVVSRMTHSNAGTFDVNLPLSGSPGIECRSGGVNGNFTVIFTFTLPLSSVGGAVVAAGIGSVTSSGIDTNDAHDYIVNLTGVTNAQVITVSLTNVSNTAGAQFSQVLTSMGVLLGDTTGDGFVNAGDTVQVRSQSGDAVTISNFREDLNADGFINAGDTVMVRNQSGTALPPQSLKTHLPVATQSSQR